MATALPFPATPDATAPPDAPESNIRRIPFIPIALAVAILAGTYWFSPNFKRESGPQATLYAGDFIHEWLGGYIVRTGDYSKFYNVDYAIKLQHDPALVGFQWKETEYLPIVYPPFYYILVCPFSYLPIHSSAWVWGACMTAALAASVYLVVRAHHFSDSCFSGWLDAYGDYGIAKTLWPALVPWLLPVATFFAPLLENLVSSQKGTVCLLILTSTFLLLDTKRPFSAGLVFGLLAFKPQLTLVIAFAMLLKGQWRFVAGGATMGFVLGGLSLMLGFDVCQQFYRFSTGMANYIYNEGYDLTKSHCLYGFYALIFGAKNTLLVKGATGITALGVIALLAILLRGKIRYGESTFGVQFGGLVLATLLLSPHLFSYDLTMLLLPMLLLILPQVRSSLPDNYRNPVLWLTTLLFAAAGFSQDLAQQIHVQVTTVLMLTLLAVLTVSSRQPSFKAQLQTALP